MTTEFYRIYDELFIRNADFRVEKWPLMKDPFSVIFIMGMYLYAVYHYIPNQMKHRKPYDLKMVLLGYNVFQLLACAYIIGSLLKNAWLTEYSLGCEPVDYSNSNTSMNILRCCYFTFWVKMAELVETCFFCMRKKTSQVTVLHVYHHISTLGFAWVVSKYLGGGMVTFTFLINSLVHFVMYSYYLLAALGPSVQRHISWIKPSITIMQMSQFWIILFHSLQVFQKDCQVPNLIAAVYVPNMIVLFVFFLNFYLKSYKKTDPTKIN